MPGKGKRGKGRVKTLEYFLQEGKETRRNLVNWGRKMARSTARRKNGPGGLALSRSKHSI